MKNIIIVFLVVMLVIGFGLLCLKKRNQSTQAIPDSSTQKQPALASGVSSAASNAEKTARFSQAVSTQNSAKEIRRDQNPWGVKDLPLSSVDRHLNISPVSISVNGVSNEIGRTGVSNFVGLLNKDMLNLQGLLLKGNFSVGEWNLYKSANIVDPMEPVVWNVSFNNSNNAISGIRKVVFKDASHHEELRSQGYDISFFPGGQTIDRYARNDGSESLLCYSNGQVSAYRKRFDNMNSYLIYWDEKRNITSEKITKPSPQVIAAKKRLVEEYKNDPNKADWVRGIQEELNRMQSNR